MVVAYTEILESIKDCSILDNLKDYEYICLAKRNKTFLNKIIEYNERRPSILPKTKKLMRDTGFSRSSTMGNMKKLSRMGLAYGFTFPQIFTIFGYYESHKPKIPNLLNLATNFEIDRIKGRGSFIKKMKSQSPTHYGYFNIATIKKDGIPVFAGALEFIPAYKALLEMKNNKKL